jgi:hypothetical protein
MYERPINDDELMVVDDRLRTEATGWRLDPPADLHQRTMRALAGARPEGTAAGAARTGRAAVAAPSGDLGRVPHGLALAAACLALLITTWAALVLQSPPASVGPEANGGDGSGGTAMTPSGNEAGSGGPAEAPAAPPLSDILAQASLESEMAALETDARTLSSMMTRQVRLISGRER